MPSTRCSGKWLHRLFLDVSWCGFLALLLALPAAEAAAVGAPDPKGETRQSAAQLRAYLPVLLRHALFDLERERVNSLRRIRQLYQGYEESGDVSAAQISEMEKELLQVRIRRLRAEAAYEDALEQFKLRFDLPVERLRKMDEEALLPLVRHVRRFEEATTDLHVAISELKKIGDAVQPPKSREHIRRVFTASALVKDTRFRTEAVRRWADWERLSAADLRDRLSKTREEQRKLLASRDDLELRNQKVPEALLTQLADARREIDLARVEESLRVLEGPLQKGGRERFSRPVIDCASQLLMEAYTERFALAHSAWPALPPVRLKGVDLLTADKEQAERIATATLKGPAAVAARAKVRQLRTLASIHGHQQRLFEICFLRVESILDDLSRAKASPEAAIGRQLSALRSLHKAKAQLFTNWVDYQVARLDFYSDLQQTPPEGTK